MDASDASVSKLLLDAPFALFFLDPAGACVSINRRFTELTGLSQEDSLGLGWLKLLPESERARVSGALEAIKNKKTELREELQLNSPAGRRAALYSISALIGQDGIAYGFAGWLADISERKKLEEEREQLGAKLRASEEMNQMVRRIGGFAHWTMTADDQRPTWSPEMFALWGRREEEGAPTLEELFTRADPADRPRILAATNHLLAGGSDEIEYRFHAYDGVDRWLHARRESLRGPNGKIQIVGIAQDVTWRHEAQRERLDRDRFLRGLTLALPDPAFVHNGEQVFFVNLAFALLLGWDSPEQLVGQPVRSILPSNEQERTLARMKRALAGSNNRSVELALLRRDGSACPVEMSGLSAEYEGKPAVLQLARDLSARRAAEERRLVSDRAAALATLASGVAHEVNNPLAWLQSNVEMIVDGLAKLGEEGASPALRELIAMAREAREGAQRVKTIVRDLQTFTRGSNQLLPQDPTDALELALRLVDQELSGRCSVTKRYHPVPMVLCDRALLAQAFANILLNAAQAMAGGDPAKSELIVTVATADNGTARIEIEDNGPGIEPENLPRIFEPFFTTKPVGTGTGLGLSVALNSVKAMGGSITAVSEPGQGALFRVLLPRADAPQVATEPALARERLPRVLVVDDDPLIGQSLRRLLGRECEVVITVSAAGAQEAIAKSADFDLLLVDLMMAAPDGIALYESLRTSHPQLARRIVFMTGGAVSKRERAFLDEGPRTLVEKPFQAARIRALVRDAIKANADARH